MVGTCNVNCLCADGDDDPAEFVCAVVDCPEFFNGYNPSKKCIMQYNKEDCCAMNTICGKSYILSNVEYFSIKSYCFNLHKCV